MIFMSKFESEIVRVIELSIINMEKSPLFRSKFGSRADGSISHLVPNGFVGETDVIAAVRQ